MTVTKFWRARACMRARARAAAARATERNRARTSAQICNKQGLTGRLPDGSWITHASHTVLHKNLMYLHINAKNPELPRFMTKQARTSIQE